MPRDAVRRYRGGLRSGFDPKRSAPVDRHLFTSRPAVSEPRSRATGWLGTETRVEEAKASVIFRTSISALLERP
jgi:hypothetical protein